MTAADELTTNYADSMLESVRDMMARVQSDTSTCVHCHRTIVDVDGTWSDLDASGDDGIWRETCPAHDTFVADHEPADDDDREREDAREAAIESLDEWPLELVCQVGSPYEIVLGLGGPDVRIEWDGRFGTDSAELHVRWGGDHVIRRSEPIRAMAEYFGDIMEGDQS